jgi:hypothetical protein
MSQCREQPEDYNAFGYDPMGWVANVAGLMFSEDWRPNQEDIPRYRGPGPEVAPPQYDPPADYQQAHLPNNFIPQFSHNGYLGDMQRQYQQQPWFLPLPRYTPGPTLGNRAQLPRYHDDQYFPLQPYQQAPTPTAVPSPTPPSREPVTRERPNPEV